MRDIISILFFQINKYCSKSKSKYLGPQKKGGGVGEVGRPLIFKGQFIRFLNKVLGSRSEQL